MISAVSSKILGGHRYEANSHQRDFIGDSCDSHRLRAIGCAEGARKLKSFAGSWEGKDSKGLPVEDTYRLTAGGTTVMSENKMGPEEMLSLFYVDGDRLLMTHFCPSGNQPRMQATISHDLKSISFDFLDITNLPSPQSGHMYHALYVFADADHYTAAWTWKQNGKDTTFQYEMQRKK
jgi:hypothetical protein